MIKIRAMEHSELARIGEIDRSEEVRQEYVQQGRTLVLKDVDWSVPRWKIDGEGGHSVRAKLAEWCPCLDHGGTLFGAFDADVLAGFAIYRPEISEGLAQFAVLYVGRPYRRRGIGAALAMKVIEAASADGARSLYVSSSPTRGTVEFYQSLGFEPTTVVHKELFDLEPEDVHMTLDLQS